MFPQINPSAIVPGEDPIVADCLEAREFNKRGLFIGGCQKSGTTLLMTLLDSHPQLIVFPEETTYLQRQYRFRRLKGYRAKLKFLLEGTAAERLGTGSYSGFDHWRFVTLAMEFVNRAWINDSLLFSETIRAYGITMGAVWRNCVRWVEKTPKSETYPKELDELFPDAKLIQMVRDPRAVIASRKQWNIRQKGHYTEAHGLAREWNRCARQTPRLRSNPDRFLVVQYESLVRNPMKVLRDICSFGGFEFSESMLEPTRAGNGWQGNSAFHKALIGISAAPVEKWKDCLTEHEIWWIELHCRRGMELAGYPLQTDARFSLRRWLKRLPGESWSGYVRARRASLCQGLGLLKDCRYGG
ncbi:MAG TPA: sulfotransferase [Alphaproteobacteria bacterium]|nr:sulfotransferase [Alphaproteobacteria bacterium]